MFQATVPNTSLFFSKLLRLQQSIRIRPQQHVEHQIGEIPLTRHLEWQQAITVQGAHRAGFGGNEIFQEDLQVLRIERSNRKPEFLLVAMNEGRLLKN